MLTAKKPDAVAAEFDVLAQKEGFDRSLSLWSGGDFAAGMDDMEDRIAQATQDRNQGKVSISEEMESYFQSLGYQEEEETEQSLERSAESAQAQLVTDPLCCPACGFRFQSTKEHRPGYLPPEKFEVQIKFSEWKKRYDIKQKVESEEWSADDEVEFLLQAAKENEPKDDTLENNDEDSAMIELMQKKVICQRCHRLQNFGVVSDTLRPGWTDDPALQQETFRRLLAPIADKPAAVIIALVDLFDFAGSVLPELDWITGYDDDGKDTRKPTTTHPVLLAANKADLLPPKIGTNRVENWVRRELEYLGVKSVRIGGGSVRLISCKTGAGVGSLLQKAQRLADDLECDIYVVGAANAGKSTFLNHILRETTTTEGEANIKRRAGNRNKFKGAVTASPLPGTTLQFLKVDLGNGRSLYDTPGLLVPGTVTQLLSPEELKVVVPKRWAECLDVSLIAKLIFAFQRMYCLFCSRVEPITFRVASGKAVLVGGLAKIELIGDSKPFLFTFFVGNAIKLHPTDSSKAHEFIQSHIGTLLTPPASLERYQALGEFETHDITIEGEGWKQSAADITLTGLGWVGVTGAGQARVRVSVPRGVTVTLRPPLMPFDVWETTARYTGAKPVRKITKSKYGLKKRTKGVGRR